MFNTEPSNEATHSSEKRAVTPHTLGEADVSSAMPAPDKVMMIPYTLATAFVSCWAGVNVNVAVVVVAFKAEASVIDKPLNQEIAGNIPVDVVSMTTTEDADTSFEEPAATLVNAGCAALGVVNLVKAKVIAVSAE